MDYSQAASIRKQGLLSLIAEMSADRGIGASVKGAISEKIKAGAVGIKEQLDPLRFVSRFMGDSPVGKLATTGIGRLFGRSDDTIKYFGGYGRKKKGSDRATKIGQDPNQSGSNPALIESLTKIYDFMVSSNEKNKLREEVRKNFEKEQVDEDERRHKQLVDALKSYVKAPTEASTTQEEPSFWNKIINMFNNIKQMIDPLLKFLEELGENVLGKLLRLAAWVASPAGVIILGLLTMAALTAWVASLIALDPYQALEGKGPAGLSVAGLGSEGQLPLYDAQEEQQKKLADMASFNKGQLTYQKDITKLPLPVLEAKRDQLISYGDPRSRVARGQGDEKDKARAKQIDDIETEIASRKQQASSLNIPDVEQGDSPVPSTPTPPSTSTSSSTPTPSSTSTPSSAPANTPAAVSSPVEKSIPTQMSDNSTASSGDGSSTVVTNQVNNVGSNKPKVLQTTTPRMRNTDLDRQLRNTVVPV